MTRFVDQYLPTCVAGYPCYSMPRWSTSLVNVDSGAEDANQRWENPLHKFVLPEAVRDMDLFNAVRNHWLAMRGPFHTWPWRDPLDFASVALTKPNVVPSVSDTDQELGVGDNYEDSFQLYRTYTSGDQTYRRKITLPVLDTILIGATPDSDTPTWTLPPYTISRPGGVVQFAEPIPEGVVLSWGGLFDVPVRFEADDSFDGIVKSLGVAGYSDLTFIEVRGC